MDPNSLKRKKMSAGELATEGVVRQTAREKFFHAALDALPELGSSLVEDVRPALELGIRLIDDTPGLLSDQSGGGKELFLPPYSVWVVLRRDANYLSEGVLSLGADEDDPEFDATEYLEIIEPEGDWARAWDPLLHALRTWARRWNLDEPWFAEEALTELCRRLGYSDTISEHVDRTRSVDVNHASPRVRIRFKGWEPGYEGWPEYRSRRLKQFHSLLRAHRKEMLDLKDPDGTMRAPMKYDSQAGVYKHGSNPDGTRRRRRMSDRSGSVTHFRLLALYQCTGATYSSLARDVRFPSITTPAGVRHAVASTAKLIGLHKLRPPSRGGRPKRKGGPA